MLIPDLINGTFEACAGGAVAFHCRALHQDKAVRGLSIPSVVFFTLWGFWNLYYYPHLEQPMSFIGGLVVTAANVVYVGMLLHYSGQLRRIRWALGRRIGALVCKVKGEHAYCIVVARPNALYPCQRCGREMFDRTLNDLRAMEPMSDDDLEDLHREMGERA